jgi:glycine/D-amino acid oxidase-like deaminating enzyme
MADKNVALRKRQQIENAGRLMFLWVAGAAAVVGIALVLSISLFERITFNQEIISLKNETAGTLRDNNEVVEELKQNVRVLNTNKALLDTPNLEGTEPVSVVLDALPAKANSSALGASLQQKLLQGGGVTIDSLIVDPISGVEDTDEESDSDTESANGEITFQFVISAGAGQASSLKEALRRIERSIRAIDITSVTIEQQSSRITLSAEGKSYYQPEKTVELTEVSKRP